MIPQVPDPWREVCAARVPAGELAALAPVRDRGDVRVILADGEAWVRWPAGLSEVARCLLPVPGAAFFTRRNGLWLPFGRSVPAAEAPPEGGGVAVAAVLAPGRFEPVAPGGSSRKPVALTVVRGGMMKPATALACAPADLAKWADAATTAELSAVRGARRGGRAMLLGERLPAIPGATRYWGNEVLVPLGFRAEPELPESALRDAAAAAGGEILVLGEDGAELIPLAAFEPLTRAGVRLGARTA